MQCFILGQEEIENICRQAKVLAKEYEDAPRLTGKKKWEIESLLVKILTSYLTI